MTPLLTCTETKVLAVSLPCKLRCSTLYIVVQYIFQPFDSIFHQLTYNLKPKMSKKMINNKFILLISEQNLTFSFS